MWLLYSPPWASGSAQHRRSQCETRLLLIDCSAFSFHHSTKRLPFRFRLGFLRHSFVSERTSSDRNRRWSNHGLPSLLLLANLLVKVLRCLETTLCLKFSWCFFEECKLSLQNPSVVKMIWMLYLFYTVHQSVNGPRCTMMRWWFRLWFIGSRIMTFFSFDGVAIVEQLDHAEYWIEATFTFSLSLGCVYSACRKRPEKLQIGCACARRRIARMELRNAS